MAKAEIKAAMADLNLMITSAFIPWSQSRNKGGKQPSLNWSVSLLRDGCQILTTDYGAGIAHAPGYKWGDWSISRRDLVNWECEHGRPGHIMAGGDIMQKSAQPIVPDACDVLYSLAIDVNVLDARGFEDWASDFGYDTDSRKAESIYRACLEIALKLRNGLGEDGLCRLREACHDY
jgi:hypothetical protein